VQFSKRANQITPFYAMSFGEKAAQLERQGHNVVKLNIGEPDFGAPTPVIQAMQFALDKPDLPYTSALGTPELRAAIAQFYMHKHGVHIDPKRVVVTAGASAALMLVSAALVNPGDNVLLGDPCYPCNRQFIATFGGDVSLIPTSAQTRYQLSLQQVQEHWQDNTKGLLLATPSNPTGTSIDTDVLRDICAFAKQKNSWRIIDEIYLNLSDDRNDGTSPQTILAMDDDAIVINSFSKYFGMTGWRLGWCIVPEAMVGVMESLAQNLYICPSTLAQQAALACFTTESLAICEDRKAQLQRRRQIVLEGLSQTPLTVPVLPDGAFYVYIDISCSGLDAMTFCERLLEEAHVALTPGNDFGEYQSTKYVRLSYAAAPEILTEGIQRISQFMQSCKGVM
jgi:aspartate/methionine/tyrosine aminotransferase